MNIDENSTSTLRAKLADKTLVGIKTENWQTANASAVPMIKVKAKVGDKTRPVRR